MDCRCDVLTARLEYRRQLSYSVEEIDVDKAHATGSSVVHMDTDSVRGACASFH